MVEWTRSQELSLLNLLCYHKPIGKQQDANYKVLINKLNQKFPDLKANKTSVNKILYKYYDLKGLAELDAEDQELESKEENIEEPEPSISVEHDEITEPPKKHHNFRKSTQNTQEDQVNEDEQDKFGEGEEEVEEPKEKEEEEEEDAVGKQGILKDTNNIPTRNDEGKEQDNGENNGEDEDRDDDEEGTQNGNINDSISMRINKRSKIEHSDLETTGLESSSEQVKDASVENNEDNVEGERNEEDDGKEDDGNNDSEDDEDHENDDGSTDEESGDPRKGNTTTPSRRGRGRPPKTKQSDEIVTPKTKLENKKYDSDKSTFKSSKKRLRNDIGNDENGIENDKDSESDESESEAMPPPRKRGRKARSLQSEPEPDHEEKDEDSINQADSKSSASKKRGRKPKYLQLELVNEEDHDDSTDHTDVEPTPSKKRGRKSKVTKLDNSVDDTTIPTTISKRGRKSKIQPDQEENDSDVAPTPLKKGRKVKLRGDEENESDVGPAPLKKGRKSVVLVEGTPMETPSKRGRPRKNSIPSLSKVSEKLRVEAEDTNESENSNLDDNLPARHTRRRSRLSEDEGGSGAKSMPKRGRPPKPVNVSVVSSDDEKAEDITRDRKRGRPKQVEPPKGQKRSASSKKSDSDTAEPPVKKAATRNLRKNSKSDIEGKTSGHETSELESDANDGDEEDEESDDDEAKSNITVSASDTTSTSTSASSSAVASTTPRVLRKSNVETPKTAGAAKVRGLKTPSSGMRFTPTRSSRASKNQVTPSVRRSARKK